MSAFSYKTKRLHYLFIFSLFFLSLMYTGMLLHYCHVGIDLTDEGFYLNWITTPFNYPVSHTQFGYIYHPLYRLLGENIVLLRQADFLILLGLTGWVCHALLQLLFKDHPDFSRSIFRYMLSFSMASVIYSFFGAWWWLPTPSYNSLALEALLITTLGFIKLLDNPQKATGWLILGVGWWLAFMAKPTTAIALSLCSILTISFSSARIAWKKFRFSGFVAFGLFCISALIIDGSITAFILRLYQGVDAMTLLYGGHAFEFTSGHEFLHDKRLIIIFLSLVAFTFLIVSISSHFYLKSQLVSLSVLAYMIWMIISRHWMLPPLLAPSVNILLFAVPTGASLALLLIHTHTHHNKQNGTYRALSVFLILLPYVFAIGTRGNIWTTAMRIGIFWILAIFPLLKQKDTQEFSAMQAIISLIFCSLLITTILTQFSMSYPYRQSQSLFEQTHVFDIENRHGKITSHLIISDEDKRYLDDIKHSAVQHGFHPGDNMIDFTGAFPTVLYLLGANPIGAPWYIAGYIGSTEFTIAALAKTPCNELAQAWLLTSLNGIEKYDPRLLTPHGLSQNEYIIVNDVIHAHAGLLHQYWKPRNIDQEENITRCETRRAQEKENQHTVSILLHNKSPLTSRILEQSQQYMKQKEPQKAISLLKSATFINPSSPALFNNLCVFYGIQKEYDLGIDACKHALSIDPNFQLARNNLTWLIHESNTPH